MADEVENLLKKSECDLEERISVDLEFHDLILPTIL
jgi:hypothetical protein